MKVILRKNVERVGKAGDVITVKEGFARNYLLPQGLALVATDDNLKKVENDKKKLDAERRVHLEKMRQLAEQLKGFSCTITVEAQEETLYGSITAEDICKVVQDEQIPLEKHHIVLEKPIKKLGIYEVEARLAPEVSAQLKVWVVKK